MNVFVLIAYWLFRLLAGAAGLLLLYAAFFMYENTEGQVQNRLEEWWIRLDDSRRSAASWQAAFLKKVAETSNRFFDRVFGTRLLPLRAAAVWVVLLPRSGRLDQLPGIHSVIYRKRHRWSDVGRHGVVSFDVALERVVRLRGRCRRTATDAARCSARFGRHHRDDPGHQRCDCHCRSFRPADRECAPP